MSDGDKSATPLYHTPFNFLQYFTDLELVLGLP